MENHTAKQLKELYKKEREGTIKWYSIEHCQGRPLADFGKQEVKEYLERLGTLEDLWKSIDNSKAVSGTIEYPVLEDDDNEDEFSDYGI